MPAEVPTGFFTFGYFAMKSTKVSRYIIVGPMRTFLDLLKSASVEN